jgi:hypothetical protein
VVDGGFLIELSGALVVFAHNHSKLAAGIAEDRGSVHALNVFNYKWATGTGAVRKGLVLGKAVCVPRHIELSEPGRRRTSHLLCFFAQAELQVWKLATSGTGSGTLGNLLTSSVMHITSEWRENATFSLQEASLWNFGWGEGKVGGDLAASSGIRVGEPTVAARFAAAPGPESSGGTGGPSALRHKACQ